MMNLTWGWSYRSRTAAEWVLGGLVTLLGYGILVTDPPWDVLFFVIALFLMGFMVWGRPRARPSLIVLFSRWSVLSTVVYVVTVLGLMAAGQDPRRSTTIGLLALSVASWTIAAWIYFRSPAL
jgi:hypothetical protein